MKVFVSQPMSGLSNEKVSENRDDAIRKLRDQFPDKEFTCDPASLYTDTDIEKEEEIKNRKDIDSSKFISLYYFLRSIQHMADCDMILFIDGWSNSRGCCLEYLIARMFKIPRMIIAENPINGAVYITDKDDATTIPVALKLILMRVHDDTMNKK